MLWYGSLFAVASAGAVDSAMWCPGVKWDAVQPMLSNASIDVYYVQAALFSTRPSIGTLLGDLFDLYHTAVVFEQGDNAWTLEFDATAQNRANSTPSAGFLPEIDGETLSWDSATGWCLTEGILNTKDHYKKQYAKFATIDPALFRVVIEDFVPSLNGTDGNGILHGYNMLRILNPLDTTLIDDVTCANGAHWVRQFLHDSGAAMTDVVWNVTRVQVATPELREVEWNNALEWSLMVGYFQHLRDLLDGNKSVMDKIALLNETLPMRYWYQGNTGKYFKLSGLSLGFGFPKPQYVEAPFPWPKPATPVPTPPSPPRPPATCSFSPDQDWQGGDLDDFSSVTQEDCCNRCSGDSRCLAGVWRSNSIPLPGKRGHCWLKSEISASAQIFSKDRWACLLLHTLNTTTTTTTEPFTGPYGSPPCARADETEQDLAGPPGASVCGASCDADGDCPTDVPAGIAATPSCQHGVCYLRCGKDAGCPAGSRCVKDPGLMIVVGRCAYPTGDVAVI